MELERPHRQAPSTTSDLFICFSSMRLSSKSMVSPGRTDKPPISLSASLSRRLRSKSKNGSLKGGQSPMFPPGMSNKKRGGCAAIDNNNNNPEPSSPKVTCIGQVRVKTKKHGKKMKMNMSRAYRARRSGSSGADLRGDGDGCLQHRDQRWVHLPVTICDALRGLGSEFNCFSPCKPSCFSGYEVKERKGRGSKRSSCCGSVCRWLVASHEGEGERRDKELVVGKEEDRGVERVMERECSRRRSIFDDVDFNIDEICEAGNEIGGEGEEEEEEAARVSICVPPKNALLLMRCRSDPVKMKALSSRFWESPPKNQHRDGDEEEDRAVEETGRRRSSVSERVKVESLSFFAEEETGRRRSSVNERARVESLSSFAEEEAGRRRSSVNERIKVESLSSFAEEEAGRRRSSVSERIKVESLSSYAEEETGRRRSSVSERIKVESLSKFAEEETGRRRSSVSERVKVESLSNYAEEETGRRRSSFSERVKVEPLTSYAEEETGRRRSSVSERVKFESLSNYAEEETGRRRSSVSERERVMVEALSSYPEEETGRRRSSVSERVKIESLSSSEEKVKEESTQNTEAQLEVASEEYLQGVGVEIDEELIQEEKLQKRRFSVDSKDQAGDLGVFVEDPDGKEKEAIEVVVPSGQSTDPLESAPPLEEDKGGKVGEKVSSFDQSEEEIQTQPLKEDELTTVETEGRSEQQPLEEASEDDDSMEEEANMQEREQEESGLPDCLLLMMCEPKVSMEVSKETWVCSTDFLRWLPERHRQHHLKKINPTNGKDEATATKKKKKNKTTATESNPPPPARLPPQPQGFQPPRSSCSFPIGGGVSHAGVVKEKKLVSALAYEPFVLTRCKSEPMRSATAKLAPAPELACFWKNRKIEPHRQAACGVGAAGLGC